MKRNGLLSLYSLLIAQWLNGGRFAKPGKLYSTSIKPQYNSIFTKSGAKQIYRISGIKPDGADLAFIDAIRDQMFVLHPDISLNVNIVEHPVRVDVSSEKFSRSFAKAGEALGNYKEVFESQTGTARLTGKTYRLPGGGSIRLSRERLESLQDVYISYEYLFNHISSGGTVSLCNIFFEIQGKDMRAVARAGDDIYGILLSLKIGVDQLRAVNKAYYLEMGPATGIPTKLNKKFLPQLLFTTENSAAFSTYKSRGLVGGGKNAILLGMDFRSRLPFAIDIFKSSGAQVFLVDAKTGAGKTYCCFQIALSALAQGHYVSALDVKGREWAQIAGYTKTKIISFDSRNPSFVNTLRLDDMEATVSTANDIFNTAVSGTVQLFMLILNLQPGEGNPSDAELVIREAVLKMYSMRHVDPSNLTTFAQTKDMKYSEVLPILEELGTTKSYTPEQINMLRLARSRLHNYFGPSGLFADAFRNEISLADVLTVPFVIYELNKNQNTMTDSLDVLRIFMIQFLDTKKKARLKERGQFIFCFYEELQRCQQFGNLLEYICADTTGSRSNNAVLLLLLNSLKVLQGKAAQDVRSNITSFIVGYVEDNDIRSFRDDFGKDWLCSQLNLFSERQQIYRNCFCAVIDTGTEVYETVYKVQLPKEVSEQFRTRTILTD